MGVFGAVRDGAARVNRAPLVLGGMWVLTVLVAAPLALADRAPGVTFDWTLVGFPSVLDNMIGLLSNTPSPRVVPYAAATSVGLWIFLAGGIIDRYARDHATGSAGFFAASGTFFFRFLRLALVQTLVYALLFGLLRGWPFDRVVVGALVAAANVIFDYAKVRAVVEDRRSMLGAISSACGFLRRNFGSAVAVYAIDIVLFVLVTWVYARIELTIAPVFVVVLLWVKLLFWASETALFQSRLAHAGYVARPQPSWPDSPAAEAIS